MLFTKLVEGTVPVYLALFLILLGISIFNFLKKRQNTESASVYNHRIRNNGNWILYISIFSLLLGLFKGFYMLAGTAGVSDQIVYGGISKIEDGFQRAC